MKHCLSIMIFLGCLSGYLSAECSSTDRRCEFEIGFEFLYLKPYFTNPEALIVTDPVGAGQNREVIDFPYNYQPSYRGIISLFDCVCSFSTALSYQYFSECASVFREVIAPSSIESSILITDEGPFTQMLAKHQLCYHQMDLSFLRCFPIGCNQNITPFFAVEALVMEQTFVVNPASDNLPNGTISQNSHACQWGCGLKMGCLYDLWVFSCLNLYAEGAFSLLFGNIDEHFDYQQLSYDSTLHNPSGDSNSIPGYMIRVGGAYHLCVCQMPLSISVGYELKQWFNIWSYRTSISGLSAFTEGGRTNFGYQGFTVGLQLFF